MPKKENRTDRFMAVCGTSLLRVRITWGILQMRSVRKYVRSCEVCIARPFKLCYEFSTPIRKEQDSTSETTNKKKHPDSKTHEVIA